MKITYEFVTGEISGVEVDESLGGMLLDLDRQQYNNDQKETRRHSPLTEWIMKGSCLLRRKIRKGRRCAGRIWRGCIPLWRLYHHPKGSWWRKSILRNAPLQVLPVRKV